MTGFKYFFILIISLCISLISCGESPFADQKNQVETDLTTTTTELITPDHTIDEIGSSVNLSCAGYIINDNLADRFAWEFTVKPAGSSASLSGNNSSTSFTIDKDGFYIIKFTLFKNDIKIGYDYAYVGTPSVVHYVYAAAAGSGSGADWINAWTELPTTLIRGHTYYIADGDYPFYYCNTPQDDVVPIYIKKAIDSNHGTDTGWSTAAMGDGQAVFKVADPDNASPFILNSSYIVIDGQIGEKNEPHGFKFSNKITAVSGNHGFTISHISGIFTDVENIKIKHCEIQSDRGRGFQVNSMVRSLKNMLLHSCYIHDITGITIYFVNTSDSIVEYCYVARNHSDPIGHGEGLQTNAPECRSNIIRYNIWEDIEGTAVIVGAIGWKVYGNLAFYSAGYINSNPENRHVSGRTCNNYLGMGFYTTTSGGGCSDNKVFNNTIVGGYNSSYSGATNMGVYLTGSNNLIYNNLWANCSRLPAMGDVHDYNMYYNNNSINPSLEPVNELNKQYVLTDPFVDSAAYDYHLNAETDSGMILDAEFSYDMDGKKRGTGGVWSRGAFQY